MTTGDTLSTGGNGAQGDLTGAGAGLFATSVGLSGAPLAPTPLCFACCAAAPGFRIVLVGFNDVCLFSVVNTGLVDGACSSCFFGAGSGVSVGIG